MGYRGGSVGEGVLKLKKFEVGCL